MKRAFEKLAAAGKIKGRDVSILTALIQTGFVMHRSWGLGRIKSVDEVFARMIVDFEGKPGHAIALNFATQILKAATEEDKSRPTQTQLQQLNWKLLPPGEAGLDKIRRYVQNASSRQQKSRSGVDATRLEFLLSMSPSHVYAGLDEFDGYLAFLFLKFAGAVLENPIEGNAIYVFGENWRELSKFSKTELFRQPSHPFQRIIHTDGWQNRLRKIILVS